MINSLPAPLSPSARWVVLALPLLVAGCSDSASRQPEARPPVVVHVAPAAGDPVLSVRRVPGTLRARERADLSFRTAGRIAALHARIGERVSAGQPLAELETTILSFRRQQARSALNRARAVLDEQKRRLDVQQSLHGRGSATLQSLRAAELEVDTAQAALLEAEALLAIAERDLADAVLRAPFDGALAAREFEPSTEVQAGQVVLRLDAAGPLEVTASLPGSLLASLRPGLEVDVAIEGIEGDVRGRIERIGERGENALAFPLTVVLDAAEAPQARAGMAAEIRIPRLARGHVVAPLTAIVPGEKPNAGHVFVVDQGGKTVRRREVLIGEIANDRAIIEQGLERGEQVVTAGAAFLIDGQEVTSRRTEP